MAPSPALPDVDFSDPVFMADPFLAYARLRQDAPVHRIPEPDGEYMITRHADVLAALKDPRFSKDLLAILTPEQRASFTIASDEFRLMQRHLLLMDPPDHTRLRALVSKAFTPRYVETLRPRVQAIVDDLLDAFPVDGDFDLMDAYAFPLPMAVITEMLGIPPTDQAQFRGWLAQIVGTAAAGPGAFARLGAVLAEFSAYLRVLMDQLRERPDGSLTSALLQAHDDEDALSEDELLSMMWLLLVASYDTTANLIGNGMLALLEHPEQLARLRAHPELLGGAVEELLRYCGPSNIATLRWAREDIILHGVTIPRGSAVMMVLASANRDPAQYINPEDLDIDRTVKGHVAFGHGIHYCVGAPLARMEVQIALGSLLRRFPDLRLTVKAEDLSWTPGALIRGMVRLPVAVGPGSP